MPEDVPLRDVGISYLQSQLLSSGAGRRPICDTVRMAIGTRIRDARRAQKLTQQNVADALGIRRVSVTQWELDETRPDLARIPALAGILKVPQAWLLEAGTAGPPVEAPAEKLGTIPVYSGAEGGDGFFIMDTRPVSWIDRPPNVSTVPDAFGVYITGESMVPEFWPGQTVVVDPHLPLIPGEPCVFFTNNPQDDRACIKRLVRVRPDEWEVEQWNPARTFVLDRAEWTKCHRVVARLAR